MVMLLHSMVKMFAIACHCCSSMAELSTGEGLRVGDAPKSSGIVAGFVVFLRKARFGLSMRIPSSRHVTSAGDAGLPTFVAVCRESPYSIAGVVSVASRRLSVSGADLRRYPYGDSHR
jgi:hypothetical protein